MTRLLLSTAFACLLAGTALAQDDHHREGGGAPPAHPAAPARPAAPPQHAAAPRGPAPGAAMRGPAPGAAMRGPAPGAAMRGPAPGAAMRGPAPGAAMRGPGPGGHRDYSSFHRNFSAPQRFHAQAYSRPNGWYAHRWTFGEVLPALFWTHNYWLDDYSDFGLAPPPPGTVWVRDGYDALLIDQYSGEIVQVAYNAFY
jgi:Ni/Co efflux regulator RcnB